MTAVSRNSDANIVPFDHPEFGSVRSIMIDDKPWFLLTDLARVLGYRDAEKAKRLLRDSQFSTLSQGTWSDLGGRGSAPTIVTESGLYRLMMRSDRPEAEAIQAWVEDDVLPSIRKTGSYSLVPQTYAQALRAHADAVEAAEEAQKELEAAQPKVETYDAWLSGEETDIEITDFAKRIEFTPPTKMTATLRELGVLRKDKTHKGRYRNLPTKDWEGSFRVRAVQIGTGEFIDIALITPQGQLDVREVLADNGYDV